MAGGLLSGHFTRDTAFSDNDQRRLWTRERLATEIDKFEQLGFPWSDGIRTRAQAALQWVLSHNEVATVIGGAMSIAELGENLSVPDLPPLSATVLRQMRDIQRTGT